MESAGEQRDNPKTPSGPDDAGAVMTPRSPTSGSVAISCIVREFPTPPVHDALVLGKHSAIGCVAMRKALSLLQAAAFEHIEFEDDTISDILTRESIVRIIGREKFISLVVKQIKPLMTATDILHLNIDARLHLRVEV